MEDEVAEEKMGMGFFLSFISSECERTYSLQLILT